MYRDRMPLFCDTGLAERVERVEAQRRGFDLLYTRVVLLKSTGCEGASRSSDAAADVRRVGNFRRWTPELG